MHANKHQHNMLVLCWCSVPKCLLLKGCYPRTHKVPKPTTGFFHYAAFGHTGRVGSAGSQVAGCRLANMLLQHGVPCGPRPPVLYPSLYGRYNLRLGLARGCYVCWACYSAHHSCLRQRRSCTLVLLFTLGHNTHLNANTLRYAASTC